MQSSFDACLSFTKAEEGALSLNSRDGGCYVSGRARDGELIGSNCGISARTLADWIKPTPITPEIMRDLSGETIEAIFRARYWSPLSCDLLPAGVDLMVMDFGFNDGIGPSGRMLQKCVGAKQDGWIGPDTRAALGTVEQRNLINLLDANGVHGLQQALGLATDGVIGPQTQTAISRHPNGTLLLLITALTSAQCSYYRSIGGFSVFGNGWLARTNRRQMAAYKLAFSATGS